jgi:heme oxygenase
MTDELEPYRPHIDKLDLTEDEKLELVNAIENIIRMILDKKFREMDGNKKD